MHLLAAKLPFAFYIFASMLITNILSGKALRRSFFRVIAAAFVVDRLVAVFFANNS